MSKAKSATLRSSRSGMMVAVVLGTALSTLSPTSAATATGTANVAVNDLGRYCTACWRNARVPPDRWSDCTQEVFSRLLERVPTDQWDRALHDESEQRREFVRAIDTVKKRVQRERKRSAIPLDVMADVADFRQPDRSTDREEVDRASRSLLSPRQRSIVQKSMQGWSVHELAARMNLPAQRVSDEKYKAIRKLREHFRGAETV